MITSGERFILDWQYRRAGGFHKLLAEAMAVADDYNLGQLAEGYPSEVHCYICDTRQKGWWTAVKERAKKEGWQI
jgi:hypothetical protein